VAWPGLPAAGGWGGDSCVWVQTLVIHRGAELGHVLFCVAGHLALLLVSWGGGGGKGTYGLHLPFWSCPC
jgi:hypothetical protein